MHLLEGVLLFTAATLSCAVCLSIPNHQQAQNKEASDYSYLLYRHLFDALFENTENVFNIKQGGFRLTSGSKITCIPVTYRIICTNDSYWNMCGAIDDTWSFLWTSFDSSDLLGSLFLHYAVGGLRVFGFEWENECNAYQIPVDITLLVPTIPSPDAIGDASISDTLCEILKYITTLLPAAAQVPPEQPVVDVNGTDVSSGYAKTWYTNPTSVRTQADKYVYSIVTITAITAEIVMIGLYILFHQKVIAFLNSKKLPSYYAFWGAQILVMVLLIIVLPVYLSSVQHNIAIVPYVYLMTLSFDFSAAFILSLVFYVQNGMSKFLPVPFSSWLCCKNHTCERFQFCNNCVSKTLICCIHQVLCRCLDLKDEYSISERTKRNTYQIYTESDDADFDDHTRSCSFTRYRKRFSANELKKCSCFYIYRWFLNLIGLTMILFFTSYVVHSLPNVLIAYYAYPSRTLLRLSFIQLALISLLITLAGLLYLLEKVGWLCYARNRKSPPPDISAEDYESVVGIELHEISSDTNYVFTIRLAKIMCQITTIFFTLIALLTMLVLIGSMIFKLATGNSDLLETLFTILPTFFGNVIIFINRKKLFHNYII